MTILALELSSGKGSIAFFDDETNRFATEFANDRKHSGLFFENLQRCLQQCSRPDRIAVGLGPGSYAGTRIAISTAIGLHAGLRTELVGLPSACAMPGDAGDYIVIGDARRQSFFFMHVAARRCVDGPRLCSEEELRELLAGRHEPIFCSEALPQFGAVVLHPSAIILAQIAAAEVATPLPLEPIYLREPHITEPRRRAV